MLFPVFFSCARHGQQLRGESPLRARQQKALAEGKDVPGSEGSRMLFVHRQCSLAAVFAAGSR